VHALGATILFTLWSFAAVSIAVQLLWSIRKQLKLRAKVLVDRDGDGEIEAHEVLLQAAENVSLRLQALLAALAHESIIVTSFKMTLFLIPWPFYMAVFSVCWCVPGTPRTPPCASLPTPPSLCLPPPAPLPLHPPQALLRLRGRGRP
jgi:hypothetical protein